MRSSPRRVPRQALLLLASFSLFAMAAPANDFSAELDALWDFGAPARSEERFRALISQHPAISREAREATTQLARALGLQRKFAEADATLDSMRATEASAPARIRVRYLLERGRVRNSSGRTAEAVSLFKDAILASAHDDLPAADYYRVDALHMLGVALPPNEQFEWTSKALAIADASTDARVRGWRASLLHNLGWTVFELGDPAKALDYWQKALAAREAGTDVPRTRVAKWTVARGLRAVGRLDEAERIQRALVDETERAGVPDGFAYEELVEIALARRDEAAAKTWAAKAYQRLKEDVKIQATDPERLMRLARLGGVVPDAR